ncbi:ATP-dependent helicase HrpB [Leucobacter viscericola]|uniref:ATP-dependent helicase HrpB n=1 Tax=Leucobacter viscericola TaxID=2714935 RepID=A0A6G7XJD4_9MICO|nr:ATP-dependent helicase HrpB [Leucobacter viscericola]QIK64685.1 ATP-dependent helicase HrpB [Leucobacter viscericola]
MTPVFNLTSIGVGLPVAEHQDELESAAKFGVMVVTAPPGTGKTTFVPPLVANLVRDRGTTLLTQPRRVAVRAAANRIAMLDGTAVGDGVGFTVRGERRTSNHTRLEVLTPGVLLRRLLADPGLDGIGAVILDEVHERSVDSDLLLGMIAEVRTLRDDLLVVAMSATLDASRVAELLAGDAGAAPIVDIPSALHPLRKDHAPFAGTRLDDRGVTRNYLDHLAAVTLEAQQAEACDTLVFVPGAREVDELVRRLRTNARGPLEILPLHGRVPARDQDRAVRGRGPGDPPRVVVSTSLAESSLTVPGVHLVVDSGLSREARRDRARSMTGLVTVSASRASAEQRAGRAARQGPGRVVRAYSEADFARMPAESAPEIASADLTDTALLLAAWGTPGGVGLALPSAPPAAAMDEAVEELRALHLTDETGHPTLQGTRVARLPIGVRDARALLAGAIELGDVRLAAEVVAAISDDHRDSGADLPRLLRELRTGRAPGAERWRRESQRLERIAAAELSTVAAPAEAFSASAPGAAGDAPGIVAALGRPEWIAHRVSEGSRGYLLASGTRAALPENSGLIGSEWIAVREVQRAEGRAADGAGAVIRLAAPIAEADALRIGDTLLARKRLARVEDGRVRVREEHRFGAILLSSTPTAPSDADTGPAFAAHLRERGLAALNWSEAAIGLRARLALLHRELGEPWPAMSDEALLTPLEQWLGPDLDRLGAASSLHRIDVASALRRLLPWPEAARLEELVPERLAVPSGSTVGIRYPDPADPAAPPVISVKLQEMFGLAQTPRLVEGRVPVQVHLLSPARRPLAVTDDLSSFWNGPYQEVRREMRGRYPKHPWPEDPWAAQATARVTRPRT